MVGAPDEQHNGCSEGAWVMARRKFTREFKLSAVQLVNQQGYSIPEAAKSLGVDPNCVRYWIKKLGGQAGAGPTGAGAVQAELRRLRQDNARLRMERDILKKAAAFFAKEQL
jgi:transposase